MKAKDIINDLYSLATGREYSPDGDSLKAGDAQREVNKVAVTMFPTVKVIKEVIEWGAELLIVHEPIYYDVKEEISAHDRVASDKRDLIEQSGLTVYRFHDHAHYTVPDIIADGEFRALGLSGTLETTDIFDLVRFHLNSPITALELARLIEDKLNIAHVRICGATDIASTVISGVFGSGGRVPFEELKRDGSQIVLAGETCEWAYCEYARDAAELGLNKSLLLLGHAGSERDGMVYTAQLLKNMHPDLDVKYFECNEVYTYTDTKMKGK